MKQHQGRGEVTQSGQMSPSKKRWDSPVGNVRGRRRSGSPGTGPESGDFNGRDDGLCVNVRE